MIRRVVVFAVLSALAVLPSTGRSQVAPASPTRSSERTAPELQSRQEEEPADRPAPTSQEPVQLEWKLEPGRRLYQELFVTQKSSCQVRGIDITTGLKYYVLSSFTVEDADSDGNVTVRQKVEGTRLLEADAMARSVFGDLLNKLSGKTFRLTLNPRMEIIDLYHDEDAFPIATGGNPIAGQPLMMASLVDRDGWRELNQLTFFQPGRTLKANDRWQQPLTHSWGPLGNWKGQADYRYDGEDDALNLIRYELNLSHQPPDDKAEGTLSFRPSEATFQTEKAGGMILFDRRRGRVERAAETFHVRGSMAIELLGQKVSVEIVEQQDFQLRIFENRLGAHSHE